MADTFDLGEVHVALSPQQRFAEFLQSRGKRFTRQRRMILVEVYESHDHFDADDLMARLQRDKRSQGIGKATVYRSLSELVDAGLLRKMDLEGRAVYEHDYGYPRHDHLHCDRCGRLIEFHSDDIEAIRDAVCRQHTFKPTGHRFIITGICASCSRRAPRKPRPLDRI